MRHPLISRVTRGLTVEEARQATGPERTEGVDGEALGIREEGEVRMVGITAPRGVCELDGLVDGIHEKNYNGFCRGWDLVG